MADPLAPNLPGMSFGGYPPDLQADASAIRRRQAIADMLMMRAFQPMQQAQGPGGLPVPTSPLAALTPALAPLAALYSTKGIDKAQGDLAQKYTTGQNAAIKAVQDALANNDVAGAARLALGSNYSSLRPVGEKLINPEKVAVETVGPDGRPVTRFVPKEGQTADLPKPVKLDPLNLGGTTTMVDPYKTGTYAHTLDPNKIALPEDIDAVAKQIAEYRMPAYAGTAARSPNAMRVMAKVQQLNPSFDSSVFPVVKAGEEKFNNTNAAQVRQFGTLVGHVQAAKELYNALGNPTDVTRLNAARNFFQEEFGYPAPAALDTARPFLAGEAVKAVTGGPGSVEDRRIMAERFSKSQSPEAFNAAADTTIKFGSEQLRGHLQQLKGMTKGKRSEGDFNQYLTPAARQAFEQYTGTKLGTPGPGIAAPQGAAPAGLPSMDAIDAELKRRQGGS